MQLNEKLPFSKNEWDKVFKTLKDFDEGQGIDDLSRIFLKDSASSLVTPITQLCNLSIFSGRFPDACKIAKLKPLFKRISKTDPNNYRPICLLPLMSKVPERTVREQSMEFLEKCKFHANFNQDFERIILPTFSCLI